ncbi:MAG: hypothetical protein EOP06_23865, partial [Proteobacteria bacterium]
MNFRSLVTIASLLFSHAAFSAPNSEQIKTVIEAQPSCQNFVRVDQTNAYFGFGPYLLGVPEDVRQPIPSFFRITPLNGSASFDLKTNDAAIDIVTMGSVAFVLTHSSLEEWDMARRVRVAEYQTYATDGNFGFKQHAEAMVRYKDKLVIAHGR